jgi:hypothetical protein
MLKSNLTLSSFSVALRPGVVRGLLILEVSKSYTAKQHKL